MTLPEFANIFGVLALQLRCSDADEAMIRAYYAVLNDLDQELVQMAATRFASQPGENAAWFPKTAEWKAAAGKIEIERTAELQQRLRQLPGRLCTACDDTGWERDEATNRVSKCACRKLRRMEVLGRKPWPRLPAEASAL